VYSAGSPSRAAYIYTELSEERHRARTAEQHQNKSFTQYEVPGGNTMGVSAINTSVPKTTVATFSTCPKAEEVAGKPLSEHQAC
jgi:hypothetical protein